MATLSLNSDMEKECFSVRIIYKMKNNNVRTIRMDEKSNTKLPSIIWSKLRSSFLFDPRKL